MYKRSIMIYHRNSHNLESICFRQKLRSTGGPLLTIQPTQENLSPEGCQRTEAPVSRLGCQAWSRPLNPWARHRSFTQCAISSLNHCRLHAFHRTLTVLARARIIGGHGCMDLQLNTNYWNSVLVTLVWVRSRIPASCLLLDAVLLCDIGVMRLESSLCHPTLTSQCPCWLNASKPPPWRRWIKCLWKEAKNGAKWPTCKVSMNSCCAAAGWGPSCIEGTSISFIAERFILNPLSDVNKGVRVWRLFDSLCLISWIPKTRMNRTFILTRMQNTDKTSKHICIFCSSFMSNCVMLTANLTS